MEPQEANRIEDETPQGFLSHAGEMHLEPYLLPWGKRLWLRGLTDIEVGNWRNNLARAKNADTGQIEINDPYGAAKFLVLAIAKPDGSRFFAPDQYMQIPAMLNEVTAPLARAAMRLSAVADETIEELVKNSTRTPTSASGSVSQPGTPAPSSPSAE